MSRLAVALILPLLLLAAPGTASADVIFDPADADDLAASLAEAYTDQGVCYGWQVTVDDVVTTSESVGSNFGAGKPVSSGTCDKTVEFRATITYTSESSESEDSANYDVTSTPSGVTRDDLNALGIDFDDLTGENPDVPIGKAVIALPLLAADKGLAAPLSATPDNATTPADDAQLTDDPGSDWWRDRGGMLLWGLGLLAAGGLFVWWVLRTNRRAQRRVAPVEVPDSVPEEWTEPPTEPVPTQEEETTEPDATRQTPEPAPKPEAAEPESTGEPATAAEPESATEPGSPEQAPAPTAEPEAAEPPPEAAGKPDPAADSEPLPADRPASATTEADQSSADSATSSTEDPAAPASAAAAATEAESSSGEPAASTEDPARPAPSDRQDKE